MQWSVWKCMPRCALMWIRTSCFSLRQSLSHLQFIFHGESPLKIKYRGKNIPKEICHRTKKKKCNDYTRVEFTTIFQINNEFTELGKKRVSFHFYQALLYPQRKIKTNILVFLINLQKRLTEHDINRLMCIRKREMLNCLKINLFML